MVGSLVIVFLLLVVVMPRFARVFEDIQGELPWSAQAMVSWAHLLQDHGPSVFVGMGLCLGALVAAGVLPNALAVQRRHLRALYLNPFTGQMDWQLMKSVNGGVQGVRVSVKIRGTLQT